MEIQTRQPEMKEIANHRSGEMDGLHTVSGIGELRLKHDAQLVQKDPSSSFADMLRDKLNQEGSVRFSRHAAERIAQRGADISEGLLENLNKAVETARDKGARDTVIISRDDVFIVNIPHNVVVTMVPYQEMKENIFTNIDSAVLI